MELNEPHAEYEHASLNIKVLVLIFTLILAAVLGYLIWQQNHTSADSADPGVTHPKKTAVATPAKTTTVADNAVACGDKAYAFSMTFGALWTGHKLKAVTPTDAIITCYVNVSTTDSFWATASSTNFAGYVSIFAISVYTPAQWATAIAQPAEIPTELGHNANYYWGYSLAQSYPDAQKPLAANVPTVVGTFAIN